MKKNLRYGLIAVLILALLVVTGLVASAAGEVQLLDSGETLKSAHDTLEEAAAAAEDGDIINITADLTNVGEVLLASPDSVTEPVFEIRGNDHTVAFAADGGIVVGELATLTIENVTLTTEDYHAVGVTMDADSYDLTMTGVTITGFGTGLRVASPSVMDLTDVNITADGFGINLMAASAGGTLTLTNCTIVATRYAREPATIKDPENAEVDIPNPVAGQIILDGESNPTYKSNAGDATILCNGADIVINSGTYKSPRNDQGFGKTATFLWNDGGKGSHMTINGGTFVRFVDSSAAALFYVAGDSTLPYFGATPWVTVNDGTFYGYGNNPLFGCNDGAIKGDDDAETFVDMVINGGTFTLSTNSGSGGEPMFYLRGPMRLTINDGTFNGYYGAYFFRGNNTRGEAGHTSDPVVSNILGGTFTANQMARFQSNKSYVTVLNFGAADTEGPTFTIYNNRMDGQTGRAAIFLQNGSSAGCFINFYSGTYNIPNTLGRGWDPDNKEEILNVEAFEGKHFIHGAGAGVNFYGGTFNYGAAGYFIKLQDCDQYSVINFLKNEGENGIVMNMGPMAQRFFIINSASADRNDYNLTVGHTYGDPELLATEGDKVIITIAAGTFKNGRGWIDVSGSGFILNIGAAETDGPTFLIDEDNNYGYGFVHFSNSSATLYDVAATSSRDARHTLTKGTINVYSGNFTVTGDVEAIFNMHGGILNVYGGTFTTKDANLFQWRDQDCMGELNISGGTFTVTGNANLISWAANYTVGNNHKGKINLTGGTFQATGTATGTLFSLTSGNKVDNAELNTGNATINIGAGVTLNKVATARYFDIGANFIGRGTLVLNDRVFEQDPTAGLGGYKPVAVEGGYKVVLTSANKVFYGATMNLTEQYELHTYWKVTEAEAAAFTKVTMTGIKGITETFEITEKTERTTYPDGSDVEAGYKVLEVVLPKLTLQYIGAYYNLALYIDGNLTASIDYSAYVYLQGLSYKLDAEKAAIQEELIAANPEATAEELAAAVAEQTKTQKLAATLVEFGANARNYAVKDIQAQIDAKEIHDTRPGAYTPYYAAYNSDKAFVNPYRVSFEALETPKAAAWTYVANTNANLTGVGARFDTTMQLYVKFTAADLTGISVTYTVGEGAPQEALIVNAGGNNYVAYTQFTNLDALDKDVTFTLSGDTNTQTCTYSFAAFIYSYQSIADGENKENVAVKNLAKALKQFSDAVAQYTA